MGARSHEIVILYNIYYFCLIIVPPAEPGCFQGDPAVATLAQRHEVARIIGAAIGKGQHVVYLGCGFQSALRFALLTQRMCHKEPGTCLSPCVTITLIGFGVTEVAIVCMHFLDAVLFTVRPI